MGMMLVPVLYRRDRAAIGVHDDERRCRAEMTEHRAFQAFIMLNGKTDLHRITLGKDACSYYGMARKSQEVRRPKDAIRQERWLEQAGSPKQAAERKNT